jgi:hypothetical protein
MTLTRRSKLGPRRILPDHVQDVEFSANECLGVTGSNALLVNMNTVGCVWNLMITIFLLMSTERIFFLSMKFGWTEFLFECMEEEEEEEELKVY